MAKIASELGLSIDTVVRRKGSRLSHRDAQKLYFEILKKEYVKPIVKLLALREEVVTVKKVQELLSKKYGGPSSRTLVSRAIEQLAQGGMVFSRPREYAQAKTRAAKLNTKWKKVDSLIVEMRKSFSDLRDEQLVEKINAKLPKGQTINYNTLRRRITSLKKVGRLPNQRRGYKTK